MVGWLLLRQLKGYKSHLQIIKLGWREREKRRVGTGKTNRSEGGREGERFPIRLLV